jgi:hypothetical protein
MALSATEFLSGGKVVDPDGRRVVVMVTRDTPYAGEQKSGGRVVDADGRDLIVKV